MGLIVTLSVSYVICLAVYIFIRDWFRPLRKLPGTRLIDPFFGILSAAILRQGRILDPLIQDLKTFGPIRKCYLFLGEIRIILSDTDLIKDVLTTKASRYTRGNYAGVEFIEKIVGETGLILISGDIHKRLRRVATPAFKPSLLKSFFPMYNLCAKRMLTGFDREIQLNNGQVKVREGLSLTTLDVIGLAAFGYDFDAFDRSRPESKAFLSFNGGGLSLQAVLPFYKQLFNLRMRLAELLPGPFFQMEKNLLIIQKLVRSIVQRRKENRQAAGQPNLLDYVMASEEAGNISTMELEDMVKTFILAGHETSSIGLSWTMLCLARHPEWQQKARREIQSLLSTKKDGLIEADDVKKLKTTIGCIKESIRLFPPIPWVNRANIAAEQFNEFHIPPRTDILISIAEIHRNPEFWGDSATEFDPNRFLDVEQDSEFFMPFGDGVHKCIGYKLSMDEMAVILCHTLNRYHLDPVPDMKFHEQADISLKPNPPLQLILTPNRKSEENSH